MYHETHERFEDDEVAEGLEGTERKFMRGVSKPRTFNTLNTIIPSNLSCVS
jgi:hypothetical protein